MKRTMAVMALALAGCGDNAGDGAHDASAGDARCLGSAELAALNQHAEQLRASSALLAGHPGAREAIGFFHFVDLEVQRVSVYAGPLIMECSEPSQYDPYCEKDGLCSQIECTGDGAGWEMHFWLQAPTGAYQTATIDTAWVDGDDGITFTAASDAGAWSLAATGRMDADSAEIEETYGALSEAGDVVLTIIDTSEGVHGGTITLAGEVVAEVDAEGTYLPSAACL
jgi:hypothetical protein